jgi:predicted amidohydrolase
MSDQDASNFVEAVKAKAKILKERMLLSHIKDIEQMREQARALNLPCLAHIDEVLASERKRLDALRSGE